MEINGKICFQLGTWTLYIEQWTVNKSIEWYAKILIPFPSKHQKWTEWWIVHFVMRQQTNFMQAKRLIIQTERIYFHRIKIYIYIWFEGDCFACSLIHSFIQFDPFVGSFIQSFVYSNKFSALLSNRGSPFMIDIYSSMTFYFLLFSDPL